jgi:hypothetical protein
MSCEKWTPAEAKKFIEEANKRRDESALKWHGNKRLNQHRQLEEVKEEAKK